MLSFPESHRSTTVTVSPNASPGPTPAPDFGTAAEDGGGLRNEMDALVSPSVNRTTDSDTMTTPDLPPQSPSLPPVTTDRGIAVVDCSQWDANPEHSADLPSHPSPRQYDMV